jgi:hypothetical protein
MFSKRILTLAAIGAVALFCFGCDAEPADACNYGQATTFSIVQPQQLAVVQQFAQPVYVQPFAVQRQVVRSYAVAPQAVIVQPQQLAVVQQFAQPVYVQPFAVQRQVVRSYAVAPQAVIVQEQRVRGRDRGRQRVIVRQNLRY